MTRQDWLDLAARCESARGADRACPRCGVIFSRGQMPPSQWARKLYCSPQCGSAAHNEANRLSAKDALDKLFMDASKTEAGCVLPARKVDANGYVIARADGRFIKAHRLSYSLNVGPIPDGLVVMHKCDVRNCINPDHLMVGTNADNTADRNAKERQARGESQGRARLTDASVREIRQSAEAAKVLAERYGVGETAIQNARTGKRWSHVR